MANINSPFGFSVIGRVTGAPAPDFAQTKRLIKSDNTHSFFTGDAVQDLGTGYIDVSTAGLSQIYGIFMGCEYVSTSQQKVVWSKYFPGADNTGDVTAYICTDPYALFNVQSAVGPAAITDIGSNVDLVVGTGNTTTGISGMTVNIATAANTSTFPFRVWNLTSSQYPLQDVGAINGIDDTAAYNQVLVTFNSMVLKSLTGL